MLFSGCHSGERPKVEKCLAHLLHHPRGEGIPTILKGEIERKEGRWGEEAANQPLHTAPEQQHIAARSQKRKKK